MLYANEFQDPKNQFHIGEVGEDRLDRGRQEELAEVYNNFQNVFAEESTATDPQERTTDENESPFLSISYNWEESKTKVDVFSEAALRHGLTFSRDIDTVKNGDSISDFMRKLVSESKKTALFLGPKYFESESCMWECYHIWVNCGKDPEKFKERIVPIHHPEVTLSDSEVVIDYHRYWMTKFEKLSEHRRFCAERDTSAGSLEERWRWIRELCQDFCTIVELINDRLVPYDYEEMARNDFTELWALFRL